MKNYYKMLGYDPNFSEEELLKKISSDKEKYLMIIDRVNEIEKLKIAKRRLEVLEEFNSMIRAYGSKKNYDKALSMAKNIEYNKDKLKVKIGNIDKKRTFKVMVGFVLAAGIAFGAGKIVKNNLEIVDIPVYKGDSVVDILKDYEANKLALVGEGFGYATYPDDYSANKENLSIISKKEDVKRINEVTEKRVMEHNPKAYTFKYVVKEYDTITQLEEDFEAIKIDCKNRNLLREGEEITVYTNNQDIYIKMDNQYRVDTQKPVMSEWTNYTVENGDTVVSIAKKYNVSVKDLLEFNSNIPSVNVIISGTVVRIPTKILTGQEAIDYVGNLNALKK